MKKGILIGIIFLCLILSGCTKEETSVSNIMQTRKEKAITLYIKEDTTLGQYEPRKGVYMGAYVEMDDNIDGDITKFDKIIGSTNLFKVFQYNPKVRLESKDILKCIAKKKIPYIKLYYTSEGDLTAVYRLVMDLKNTYHTAVFIELFPLTDTVDNIQAYQTTYEKAYRVIHEHIPEATIVWSSSDTRVSESILYYPGDKLVDWVGLNIYIPRFKNGAVYFYEGKEAVDFFYKSFQKCKPMLISGLAISHFSRVDYTYTIYDTTQKLTYFYSKLLSDYPRIKGIIYANIDMGKVKATGKEDYTLTGQQALEKCMKTLTSDLEVLNNLQEEVEQEVQQYMRYDLMGSFFENKLYISERYMKTLFKKIPISQLNYIEDLEGEKFFAFEDIKSYCECYYQ